MATISEIVGDPRFARATPGQRQRLISRASDFSANNAERIEPGVYGDTNPTGQKILENAAVAAGGYGTGQLLGTGVRMAAESKLGQAVLNSPKRLGRQYAAQDAAAGIKKVIPETGAKAVFPEPYQHPSNLSRPKYERVPSPAPEIVNPQGKVVSPNPASTIEAAEAGPASFTRPKPTIPAEPLPTTIPEKIPRNFAGFKKFADSRIDKFGEQLTPQELMNYKVHLETQMSGGQIPKFNDNGKITTIYQQASDLRNKIAQVFKRVMDANLENAENLPAGVMRSRTRLDEINTLSNNVRKIPGKIASGAKTTAKYAALAAALGLGGRKLFGN